MDNDEVKFEIVKQSLHKIISNTLWLGSIDIILLVGRFQKSENLSIGQFTIPVKYIAVSIVLILCYFTLSMIQKYDRILTIYNSTEKIKNKERIKEYVNLYPSLLNPFAQHMDSKFSVVWDNLGLGLQNLAYIIGFSISGLYFISNNRLLLITFIIALLILTGLRQDYLRVERGIDTIIDKYYKFVKSLASWTLLIVYFILWIIFTIKLK